MFSNRSSIPRALQSFRLEDRMLCYNNFVPKLYNWCLSLGFTPGKIMPSRAFCSDESQGVPIILIAKHFAAFPFNHGRVGGIVSIDRHAPYAEHGKDLLILQASHVGYDTKLATFGRYRRLHTEAEGYTGNCGKIGQVIAPYMAQFDYACENIRLLHYAGRPAVLIDNSLLSRTLKQGLSPIADNLIQDAVNRILPQPLAARSTGNIYAAANKLIARLGDAAWPREGSAPIGKHLSAEDFYFRREWDDADPTLNQLERNLIDPMPWIVTAKHPLLTAACANTQAEFDRIYRSLVQEPAMRGRNLLFVAGLNIDISPENSDDFPLTKFVPWAAYLQHADGKTEILEQDEVFDRLCVQSTTNSSQLNLEQAIDTVAKQHEVTVQL